jgi:hypothetical protein
MKKLFVTLSVVALLLSGCGQASEKDRFIDASVDATCLVFQADNLFDPALEEQAKAIFDDYGFDSTDDAAMTALQTKYQEDEDYMAAMQKAITDCGGDFMNSLDLGTLDVTADGVAADDAAVTDDTLVVESSEVPAGDAVVQ